MRKISLIIVIIIIACLLISCTKVNRVDSDTITYNGATYYKIEDDNDFYLYYFDGKDVNFATNSNNKTSDSVFVEYNPLLGIATIPYEELFSDNILKTFSIVTNTDYYFKEGFELALYNELIVERILISVTNETPEIIEFSNQSITLNDIIDYDVTIKSPTNAAIYWLFGETKAYSTYLYIGVLYTVIIDDVVYIQPNLGKLRTYYKIVDEYQEVFKAAIDNANEK